MWKHGFLVCCDGNSIVPMAVYSFCSLIPKVLDALWASHVIKTDVFSIMFSACIKEKILISSRVNFGFLQEGILFLSVINSNVINITWKPGSWTFHLLQFFPQPSSEKLLAKKQLTLGCFPLSSCQQCWWLYPVTSGNRRDTSNPIPAAKPFRTSCCCQMDLVGWIDKQCSDLSGQRILELNSNYLFEAEDKIISPPYCRLENFRPGSYFDLTCSIHYFCLKSINQ